MNAYHTLVVPVLSTAHLPNDKAVHEANCMFAVYEGGWFVYIDDEPDPSMPRWYMDVHRWATHPSRNYSWVRFDSCGNAIEELERYTWPGETAWHEYTRLMRTQELALDALTEIANSSYDLDRHYLRQTAQAAIKLINEQP